MNQNNIIEEIKVIHNGKVCLLQKNQGVYLEAILVTENGSCRWGFATEKQRDRFFRKFELAA